MNKELIKTTGYLLVVDDSSINFDDWVYDELDTLFFQYGVEHKKLNSSAKKVIAHLPFGMYSSLEGVPLLPPLEQEDDEKILFANEIENMLEYDRGRWYGRIEGYNKAKEKYKFTEENAKYLFECGRNFQINADITFTVAREHLSQPKMPTHFEFEMGWCNSYGSPTLQYDAQELKNKTTTNSQGQVVACGKYIY